MKIEVNLERKYALGILFGILILAGAIGVHAIWSDTIKTTWHSADEVKITINEENYSLQEAIDESLIGQPLVIDYSNCYNTDWSESEGETNLWCNETYVSIGGTAGEKDNRLWGMKMRCCKLIS